MGCDGGQAISTFTLFLNQEQTQRKTKSIFPVGLVLKGDGRSLGPEWHGLEWHLRHLWHILISEATVLFETGWIMSVFRAREKYTEILKDIIQKPRFGNHPDIFHVPQNISSFIEKVELLCII